VWDSAQQAGLLSSEKLPANTATQDYQIWITDPAYPVPVSGGVFHLEAGDRLSLAVRPAQPVAQATAFSISLEKKGGASQAEGPVLLRGKF
jgi:anti-sigma-K factor RskA